ncbi:MAG TPA: EamA family transporter RarD [Sphingomicrobium sp.]|nr:EamA family transporter RarD [Sphingomicrobium sp.]
MNAPHSRPADEDSARRGLGYGLAAYGFWGLLPIYFKALEAVPPVDIVAHRILWSVPFLALLVGLGSGWRSLATSLRNRATVRLLLLSALLIAINWLVYVYAVVSGHILAGSLGYYLNPLANVLLGRFVLKERLSWLQWSAVAIAALGVSALAMESLSHLWISLVLCVSFATYGLIRKIVSVGAVEGMAVETALLSPFALAWLGWGLVAGTASLGVTGVDTALLLLSGIVTMIPLLLFTGAARRLRYSTLGMLQFLAPTLQFIVAVWIYGEQFTGAHAIAFGSIWIALILYVAALRREHRAGSATLPE